MARAAVAPRGPGGHEACLIQRHAATLQPFGGRIRADEQKYVADRRLGFLAGPPIAPADPLQHRAGRPVEGDDLGLCHQFDVRSGRDAIDEIARHAFGQA